MYEFKVQGMTCKNCVNSVRKAIQSVDPKADPEINLPAQTIKLQSVIDFISLESALEEAGYPIIEKL
ncbi:copper chaperone [Bdellovibrio sp. ZAP7]|uniref:heavy-metal-associated domain-containing protein n=1 Tax=Bdellovibrio sp. ZAP7 TaxID=2231053 RepID=UPI0011571096|nr:heavy-metal-associated domain-containing protein [Bdellovibrio sp. ZAP7]QDK44676.1 copper chaperone [Bdellovibrio sp. ZAP7]